MILPPPSSFTYDADLAASPDQSGESADGSDDASASDLLQQDPVVTSSNTASSSELPSAVVSDDPGTSEQQAQDEALAESSQEAQETLSTEALENAPPASTSLSGQMAAAASATANSGIALMSSVAPTNYTPGVEFSEEPLLVYTTSSAPSEVTATYLLAKAYESYGYYKSYIRGMEVKVEVTEGSDLIEATCDSATDADGSAAIRVTAFGGTGSAKVKVSFHSPYYSWMIADASAELEVSISDSPNYVADVALSRDGEEIADVFSLYAFASPDPNDRGKLFQQSASVDVAYVGIDPDQVTPGGIVGAVSADESIVSVSASGNAITVTGMQEGETEVTLTVTPKVANPDNPDLVFEKTITVEVKGLTPPTAAPGVSQLTFGAAQAGSTAWSSAPLITYNVPENADNEGFVAWLESKGYTLENYALSWRLVASVETEDAEVFSISPISTNWWSVYNFQTTEPGLTYVTVVDQWGQEVRIPVVVTAVDDYPVPAFLRDEYTIEVGTSIASVAASWMTATVYHNDPSIRTNSAPVYITTEDLGVAEETGETNNVVSLDVPSTSFSVNADPYVAPGRSPELDGLTMSPQYSGLIANKMGYVKVYAYYLQANAPYGYYPVLLDTCWVNVVDQIEPIDSIEIKALSADEEGNETYADVSEAMNISEVQTLRAIPDPFDATQMIGWESSDTSVLTMDQTGVVSAVGQGEAVVTAYAADSTGERIEGGAAASVSIAVSNAIRKLSITSLTQPDDVLSPLKIDYNGGAYKLAAQILPSSAVDNPHYVWSVEDVDGTNVCMIRQDGTLVPWGYGRARVTCTLADTNVSASVDVIVMDIVPATSVSIEGPEVLVAGESETASFAATLGPASTTDTVVWSSSNTNVLSIDPDTGEATLVGDGTAVVKATVVDEDGVVRSGVAAEKQVQCQVPLTGIEVPSEVTLSKYRTTVNKWVWSPADGGIVNVDVDTDVINSIVVEAKPLPSSAGSVSYTWEVVSDIDASVISGWSASGSKLTVVSDTDKGATEQGSAQFKVVATDGYGNSYTQFVTVNVVPNAVPRLVVNGVEISEENPLEMTEGDVVQVECYVGDTRVEDGRMVVGVSTGGGVSPRDYGGWGGWLKATEANEDSPFRCVIKVSVYNANGGSIQYVSPTARVIVHPRPYVQPPTSISVSPSKVMLNINEDEYDMTYSLRWPSVSKGGTLICPEDSGYGYEESSRVRIEWSSSNPAVAEVDATTGHVTPLALGTVYVYGTVFFQNDEGVWEQVAQSRGRVDVFEPEDGSETPARRVTIDAIGQLKVGESAQAVARVLPYPYASQVVTWSSSDPDVISIDSVTGIMQALKEGACTITAETPNGLQVSALASVNGSVSTSGTGGTPSTGSPSASGQPSGQPSSSAASPTATSALTSQVPAEAEQIESVLEEALSNDGETPAVQEVSETPQGSLYRNVVEADAGDEGAFAPVLRVATLVGLLLLLVVGLGLGAAHRWGFYSKRRNKE